MKASGRSGGAGGLKAAGAAAMRLLVGIAAPRWHVGALVVLRDERGRVCLLEHRLRPKPWGLPGGFAAWPETPREAAARECAEELGLEVAPEALRYVDHLTGEKLPYLEVVFALETPLSDSRKARLVLQEKEIKALRWVEPFELDAPRDDLAMLERHRLLLVAFLRGGAGVR